MVGMPLTVERQTLHFSLQLVSYGPEFFFVILQTSLVRYNGLLKNLPQVPYIITKGIPWVGVQYTIVGGFNIQ